MENQAWIERPGAALQIRGARQINFSGCTFKHLGATGLDYEWAVNNCRVEGCLFTDIGGTALALGALSAGGFETHVPYMPEDEREY